MAKKNIRKFFEKAMTEKALAEKFAALAAEYGYNFTVEELLDVGAVKPLSDGDVGNASGGQLRPSEDMAQGLTVNELDWIKKRHRG